VVKTTTHGKKLDLSYLMMQTLYHTRDSFSSATGFISEDKNCPCVRQRLDLLSLYFRMQTNSTNIKSIVLTGDIGHTQKIYTNSTFILTILIIIK